MGATIITMQDESQTPDIAPNAAELGETQPESKSQLEQNPLQELQAQLELAKQEGNEHRANIIAKKIELYRNEFDSSGSAKFKKFGREMVALFSEVRDGKGIVERNEKGELRERTAEPKDGARKRFLIVNMGELDRLNKEGKGHAAGDEGLTLTQKTIEGIVAKSGKKAEIFRFSGNEFFVSFDAATEAQLGEIAKAVEAAKPKPEGFPGISEGVPLAATELHFQEVIEVFNAVQSQLVESEQDRVSLDDPRALSKEVIEIVKEWGNYSLDVKKYQSRAKRIQDKFAAASALPEGPQREEAIKDVKDFFKNYMEKLFQGTGLDSVEKIVGASPEEVKTAAFDSARESRLEKRGQAEIKNDLIDLRVEQLRKKKGTAAPLEGERGKKRELADVPELTEGLKAIEAKKAAFADVEKSGSKEEIELAQLDLEVEIAKRDQGTGLLERGVHYENLEKRIRENKDVAVVFVDMAFLKYFDHRGGADVGDAALKSSASMLERAIAESGVTGEAYRYGGDEFTVQIEGGDAEAAKFNRKLAELQEANGAIPSGKRKNTRGYYPNELVFNVGFGDKKSALEVYAALEAQNALSDEQKGSGRENFLAEIATTIADKGIEAEKAVGRFNYLIDRKLDADYGQDKDKELTMQVDLLVQFSNKAIFTEAKAPEADEQGDIVIKGGVEKLQGWLAEAKAGKNRDEITAEIKLWVAERQHEARLKTGAQESLRDRLIEERVQADAERREKDRVIDELETKIEALNAAAEKDHQEIAKLRGQVAQLRGIAQAREDIDKAA